MCFFRIWVKSFVYFYLSVLLLVSFILCSKYHLTLNITRIILFFQLLTLFFRYLECIEIANLRTFSSIYKTRVDITWDAVPNATLYQVTVLRFPLSLSSIQNASTNKATLNHLSPGSSYTITCKVLEFNNTPTSLSVSSPKLLKLVMNSGISIRTISLEISFLLCFFTLSFLQSLKSIN